MGGPQGGVTPTNEQPWTASYRDNRLANWMMAKKLLNPPNLLSEASFASNRMLRNLARR
jgi:hypothetical protein